MVKALYLVLAILSTTTFLSCSSQYNPEDHLIELSKFELQSDILLDGDEVEIIGASGNLTQETHGSFYNLVVVKSVKSGDTINVLMSSWAMLSTSNPYTQFVSVESTAGKLLDSKFRDELVKQKNVKIDEIQVKSFDFVFLDEEFIQIDVTRFPCIIGNLGRYEIFEQTDDGYRKVDSLDI